MRFLRTNTAVLITVGPFYDKTDGVTIKTALTITNERITLTADTDAGSAPTNILDNVTGATSGTSNDLNYITGNDAGMMQLELAAADTNRVGRMFLSITDAANHVPVFHEFMVIPAAIYDWLILGSIVPLPANVTTWNGTAVATPATAGIPDVNAKNWNNLTTVDLPLAPTTAGRKLDVSAGGEAGMDWANVGSPTTTLGLTGTTIATTQKVDIETIKTNPVVNAGTVTFPTTATLASTTNITAGTIATATNVTTVNGLAANVITATSINADAITAAKIADGAIDRATFAADTGLQPIRSNTAQAGAATTITLDASASASNNFYNNTLIVLTGGTGAGQARFISAYVGATKVATVSTWVTNPDNTTTFAILPFDAVAGASAPTTAQIATAVWQDLLAGSDFSTASSIGKLLKDDVDGAISSRMATYTQPTGFLAATFPSGTVANTTNITAGTITTATNLTTNNDKTGYGLSSAAVQAIWDALTSALTTVGSIGKLIVDNLNAAITSRMATYTQPTGFLAATFPGTVASPTNITAGTITTTTNLTNLPAITANWLTATGIAADAITAAKIADGAIDRATFAADTGLQSIRSNTAQAGAATTITLDASASASNNFYNNTLIILTGGTGVGQARFISAYVGATKVATVSTWVTNPDNTTTFAILPFDAVAGASAPTTAQIATAVWQDLLAGSDFSTASSIGKLLKDDIDGAISSRMATYTQPTGFLAATFPGAVASPTNITAGTITTVTNLTNAPTAGDLTATMKTSVTTAATAATPIAASVTGSIGSLAAQAKADVNAEADTAISDAALATASSLATVAGYIDTEVASILAAVDTEVAAIKSKTDSLTFTVAGQADVNIQSVNNVTVNGTGASGSEWGP